jgi:hypothetical protein|tara:strand:+ start:84 stop:353 length:270 start_codon:yes stop_codon:yes gene_type:complete
MQTYKENEINIEAKENTSPTIKLERPPHISMSCGCTEVTPPSDNIYTITIDNLLPVKYMVSDPAITHYDKQLSVTINAEKIVIKIKVTK